MLRARPASSGSMPSRAAVSARVLSERVSAARWARNTPAIAVAAKSTTRKAAPAYLNLKLAALMRLSPLLSGLVPANEAGPPLFIVSRRILTAAGHGGQFGLRAGVSPAGSAAGPGSLNMSQHQHAHGRHRILAGREDRGPPPQQLPVLAAQDLTQVLDVSIDRLEVR